MGNTALRDAALLAGKLTAGQPLEPAIAAYLDDMMAYAFPELNASIAYRPR